MTSESHTHAVIPTTSYNNFFFAEVLECSNDSGVTSSRFLPARLVAGGNVDKGFKSALEFSCVGDQRVCDTAKTKKGNAIFVEGNAPSTLLSVRRRLVSEMKQVIFALKFSKFKVQLDIESREVNAVKNEYGVLL